MSSILILTYYWPPDNSSGVQRWLYFAHFLQKLGHRVEVITVNPKYASYKNKDDSFVDLTKNIKIHRTFTLEPLKIYSFLKTGSTSEGIPRGSVDGQSGLLDKVASRVRSFFFIPDARKGWVPFAFKRAKKVLKKGDFDFILTTGPPHSVHLIGLKLIPYLKSTKWIADFRDPWSELYYENNTELKSAVKNAQLEYQVLSKANHILTIGPSLKKLLDHRMEGLNPSPSHYIYNGFDSNKFQGIKHIVPKLFTISYVGLLADSFPIDGFIEALKLFCDELKEGEVELKLAGNISTKFLAKIEPIHNLHTDYLGFITHHESLTLMRSSSVLLSILPEMEKSEIVISGKIMEYIASSTPILCLGNTSGDAAALINKTKTGLTLDPYNSIKIYNELKTLYYGQSYVKKEPNVEEYSRKSTSIQLSNWLTTLNS